MVIITFRTRLKDGIDMHSLEQLGARMYELASAMPGFIAYKDFAAQDGESLTLVQFHDLESLAAWRTSPTTGSRSSAGGRSSSANTTSKCARWCGSTSSR